MSPHDDALSLARECAATMYARDAASQTLGITVEIPAPGQARAEMTVRDDMLNGFGVCHGGIVFALADTAFAFACNAYGQLTVAAGADIDFLRPVRLGDCLIATAVERHRGRRSGVYDVVVEIRDANVVAVFRGRSATTTALMTEPR